MTKNVNDRWEDGDEHDPRSIEMAKKLDIYSEQT